MVELPTWPDDAAALLLKKPWLAPALDGYLEGVYARPEHPFLALICFTSAVESVATRIFYEEVCPECRSRRNVRRIYTEGLRVLLGREAAARLDNEYVARSKTAHTGKLHGIEAMRGVPMFLDWSGADEVPFYGRVWRTEAAAREVLLPALQDRLPARTHLPEPEPRYVRGVPPPTGQPTMPRMPVKPGSFRGACGQSRAPGHPVKFGVPQGTCD